MDEKLIANICYEFETAAGLIKLFMPDLFERQFDPDKIWTPEEFETIKEYTNKSERLKALKEDIGDLFNELFEDMFEE